MTDQNMKPRSALARAGMLLVGTALYASLLIQPTCGGSSGEQTYDPPDAPDPPSPPTIDADVEPITLPEAGPALDGTTPDLGEAYACDMAFPKTGSATAGNCTATPTNTFLTCATAGDTNVTEIDPATGTAQQTLIPGVTCGAVLRNANGTMLVGRTGTDSLAMLIAPTGAVSWASKFGTGLTRAVDVRALEDGSFIVAHEGSIARFPVSGTSPTNVSFNTPPIDTVTRALAPLPGSGWAAAMEIQRTFPEQDVVVIAVAPNGTVAWQKLLANGGRSVVTSLTPLSDGGLILTGGTRPAGATVAMSGWAVRFAGDGTVTWQRTYGSLANPTVVSAVQTANGFRLVGAASGGLVAIETNADGSVAAAMRYGSSSNPFLAIGGGVTASGGLALMGITVAAHTYQFVKTNANLSLPCSNGQFAAAITVPSEASTLNVTDSTFVLSSAALTTTPVTVTVPAVQPLAVTKTCGN